jgi:hypothetical protein
MFNFLFSIFHEMICSYNIDVMFYDIFCNVYVVYNVMFCDIFCDVHVVYM